MQRTFFALCAVVFTFFPLIIPVSLNAQNLPVPQTPSRADLILRRVAEADAMCGQIPLNDKVTVVNGVITERLVVLCALNERDQSWHVIELRLPHPTPVSYKNCIARAPTLDERTRCTLPFRVVTPGYDVEHVGWGYGVERFTARVYLSHTETDESNIEHHTRDDKLTVYRVRHIWFDNVALANGDTARTIQTAVPAQYTPYQDDLADPELVLRGRTLLYEEIAEAQDELRRSGVLSRAYPVRLLADVVPWEVIFALAVIEHTDDLEFQQEPLSIEDRFVEFALNGRSTFMWSESSAHAIGLMQFTNNIPPSNKDPHALGTYDMVAANYPDAQLDPVFERGALEHVNAIKAAICLIDLELSQFPTILPIFHAEPLFGAIYPVAAYNGGPLRARELYQLMKKGKIKLIHANTVPQSITTPKRCVQCRKGKRSVTIALNGETYGYIKKYIYLISTYLPSVVIGRV